METQEQAAAAAIVVGIDVSKAALDVALPLDPQLIVLEATGGLERLVVAALAVAGWPIAVVNPRQVRGFAKATGPAGQDRRLGRCGARPLR
jgi:transposase